MSVIQCKSDLILAGETYITQRPIRVTRIRTIDFIESVFIQTMIVSSVLSDVYIQVPEDEEPRDYSILKSNIQSIIGICKIRRGRRRIRRVQCTFFMVLFFFFSSFLFVWSSPFVNEL